MGCSCEGGSRDSFLGIIQSVTGVEGLLKGLQAFKGKVPGTMYSELVDGLKGESGGFAVLVTAQDGCEVSMGHRIFPQTEEWARARIGKPLHFTITQLPRQGGMSVDVHEIAEPGGHQ